MPSPTPSSDSNDHIIEQNCIGAPVPPIEVHIRREEKMNPVDFDWLLPPSRNSLRSVGISPAYRAGGKTLAALALGVESRVLIVRFFDIQPEKVEEGAKDHKWANGARKALESRILCRDDLSIYAFDLGDLSLLLHCLCQLYLVNGVDIQSALPVPGQSRSPAESVKYAIGDNYPVYEENVTASFDQCSFDPKLLASFAQRAWLSFYISMLDDVQDYFYKASRINTKKFSAKMLEFLSKTAQDSHLLGQMKSDTVSHDFTSVWDSKTNSLQANAGRFQNRFMKSSSQKIQVQSGDDTYTVSGNTAKVKGRSAKISTTSDLSGKDIMSISTISPQRSTQADVKRTLAILHTLQGLISLSDNPFLQHIWSLSDDVVWPEFSTQKLKPIPLIFHPDYPINSSQSVAIQQMLSFSSNSRVCLIQGPPGTGKTTVIATYVLSAIAGGYTGIWLVAQSNVAVKNIAEKLVKMDFEQWRLVVSQDFHVGWHEHLYGKIQQNVINTEDFKSAAKKLKNTKVILSTLSMLSNARLKGAGFFNVVPMHTLIIDEASQIEVGDYTSIFSQFDSLKKVCFIGDDKQLPPYGQEDIENLESIFEKTHLHKSALFLDTQYRMPSQIGDFISEHVYENKLLSWTDHPVKPSTPACHFIDVADGKEHHFGTSWMNDQEIHVVVQLAQLLQEASKSFKIITPYDPQRTAIEKALEEKGLDWSNKCFNVDSFQGNEDDFIIISLVRSRDLGFLVNLRRTNVMLTRCKRAMYICTSKAFMDGKGEKTLVGKMAAAFGAKAWLSMKDLQEGRLGM